jgi:hypothetical protein
MDLSDKKPVNMHNLYTSPNTIRTMNSRTMIWIAYAVWRNEKYTQYFVEELESLENVCVNKNIILKLFLKNMAETCGLN